MLRRLWLIRRMRALSWVWTRATRPSRSDSGAEACAAMRCRSALARRSRERNSAMRQSVSVIPGSMLSSFPRCLVPVITALVERGAILRFLLSERIVEIAERDYGIRRAGGAAVASVNSAYGEQVSLRRALDGPQQPLPRPGR